MQDGRSFLRVLSVLHSIWHHSFIGKFSSVLASPSMNCFLCADAHFGHVLVVNVCSNKLVVKSFFVGKICEASEELIIEWLYFWSDSLL